MQTFQSQPITISDEDMLVVKAALLALATQDPMAPGRLMVVIENCLGLVDRGLIPPRPLLAVLQLLLMSRQEKEKEPEINVKQTASA